MVSAEMRILARSAWNLLVFMLNSLIFILIGLQLSDIVSRLEGYTGWQLAADGLAISMVAILVRFGWVYFAEYVPAWLGRLARKKTSPPLPGEAFIVSWCGMRGIVSLAAAAALPPQIPYRDLLIFLAFVVILVTLVLQGLTVAPLIRRLKLGTDHSTRDELRLARTAMGKAALAAVGRAAGEGGALPEVIERIRAELAEHMAAASPLAEMPDSSHAHATRVRLAAVHAARDELIRLWQEGTISDEVLHHVEEELDYDESRL
jgi:CPA1 family monovalent cation:H+ antiporter